MSLRVKGLGTGWSFVWAAALVGFLALGLWGLRGSRAARLFAAEGKTAKTVASATGEGTSPIGQTIDKAKLKLIDLNGNEQTLAAIVGDRVTVVAFLGAECPLARIYATRLEELARKLADKNVSIVGVFSNRQDTLADVAAMAKAEGVTFPLYKDLAHAAADAFSATRTPQAFVIDAAGKLQYGGRIDDQFGVGYQRKEPERHDLAEAVEAVLAGRTIEQPWTKAEGCLIGRRREAPANASVNFAEHVATIFYRRCAECHREGSSAPFELLTYESAAGWADTIAEVVRDERMPPWHASPEHGRFANDARLSPEEKATILKWVATGAASGDLSKQPPAPAFPTGWRIPQPDLVLYISDEPVKVPAKGEVRYQYFEVDPGFKEDRWIEAAECLPGNPRVVHHILVLVKEGGSKARVEDLESEWLAATAPGARPTILPAGMAKRIPAGGKLIFQMHYTPCGTPQTDRSSIGLKFADPAKVRREVATGGVSTHRFEIPPGAGNHRVEASQGFHKDTLILGLFPHMHLRGKAFRYEAELPGGQREILLDIPRYDFNWQNSYIFAEPYRMPAGGKLICTAHYDNSEANLSNPDPTARVRWGDQTWEEMMIGYYDAAIADADLTAPKSRVRTEKFLAAAKSQAIEISPELAKLADQALDSVDDFTAFGKALQSVVPQLDRVCLTSLRGAKVKIEFDAQPIELRKVIGGRGLEVKAAGFSLAEHAQQGETIVHPQLKQVTTKDMTFMSVVLASSMHVPAKYDGAQATLNFWSREEDAFPPAARTFLEAIARRVTASR